MPQDGWPRKLPPVSYLFYRIYKHAMIFFKINNLETRPVQEMNPNNIFSSKNVQKMGGGLKLKLTAHNFTRPLVIHRRRLFYHQFFTLYLKLQSVEKFCLNQARYLRHFFEIWNIFEYVLRYFLIENNYKLLITFQRVDVYLMKQSKLMN